MEVNEEMARRKNLNNLPRINVLLDGTTAIRLRKYCADKGLIQNKLVNLIINSYIYYIEENGKGK